MSSVTKRDTSAGSAGQPHVVSVNISPGGIPKLPLPRVRVTEAGLEHDGHNHEKHQSPMVAVSLIDLEDMQDLKREGFDVGPGATGENVTVQGLDVDSLQVGDRLRFSGGVEVELTKKRKPCYVLDAIDPELKKVIVGRCGFLARVITTGELAPGETIAVERSDESGATEAAEIPSSSSSSAASQP